MEVYVYSLRWYCDLGINTGGKMLTAAGVVAANDMAHAVKRLTTELYENVEEIALYTLEGSDSGYVTTTAIDALIAEKNLWNEE